MHIRKPNDLAGPKGNKSPARPDWFVEWVNSQVKWGLLECGCIEDVTSLKAVSLLTGKKIYIQCPFEHGFQLIKKSLTLRDVLKAHDITIPDDVDPKGLFPPF